MLPKALQAWTALFVSELCNIFTNTGTISPSTNGCRKDSLRKIKWQKSRQTRENDLIILLQKLKIYKEIMFTQIWKNKKQKKAHNKKKRKKTMLKIS